MIYFSEDIHFIYFYLSDSWNLTLGMNTDIERNVIIYLVCLELAIYWLCMGNIFIFIGAVREL